MKTITFKFFHDGKEIPKTQAQNMFQNSNFTVKDDKVFFTTVSSPVSQFFSAEIDSDYSLENRVSKFALLKLKKQRTEELPLWTETDLTKLLKDWGDKCIGNYNSTRHKYNPVREALKQAGEHQAKNGREKNPEAERFGNFLLDEDEDVQWHFTKLTPEEKKILDEWEGKDSISQYDTKSKIEEKGKLAGVKETEGKLDYSEINFKLFDLMAKRFMSNKHKYPSGNTKKPLDLKQIEQATFRHLRKMIQPIEGDEETYLDHLSAIATNLSVILDQLELQK